MTLSSQPNPTMTKFGYPDTLICEYAHWVVLLRPQQATLGALVLACKDPAEAFSAISKEAFRELHEVTSDIERNLSAFRSFQKINYLMLMMVDKDVHFHVLPRYDGDQEFGGATYHDSGWPAVPNLADGPLVEGEDRETLLAALKAQWAGSTA